MSKKTRSMKVPAEFYGMVKDLSIQESAQNGDSPSMSRVMRLLTNQYKDRIVFKGKKIDFKIFK